MPTLIIHTAQIRYTGPDKLDITVGSAKGLGRTFAPTWNLVMGYKENKIVENLLAQGSPGDTDSAENALSWEDYRCIWDHSNQHYS